MPNEVKPDVTPVHQAGATNPAPKPAVRSAVAAQQGTAHTVRTVQTTKGAQPNRAVRTPVASQSAGTNKIAQPVRPVASKNVAVAGRAVSQSAQAHPSATAVNNLGSATAQRGSGVAPLPTGRAQAVRVEHVAQATRNVNAVSAIPVSASTETSESNSSCSSDIAKSKKVEVFNWWKKASPLQRELCIFVLIPTLLVFFYTAFLWSPMYESETKFAVRSGTEQSYGVDIASQLLKTNNSSVQDAQVVEAYIRSPDIFEALNNELKVIEHYSSSSWDWLSRLPSEPTLWDKQFFWNWVSTPVVNPDNGIVTYTVRAYDPRMAQAISRAVLNRSEALVNEMNERARKDTLALSEKEVEIAKDRVAKAQQALEDFRNQHRDLDPQATASGLQTIVFELEGERAKLRAEIEEARSYMKASAPQFKNMQSRLTAIEKQLAVEKARLVDQEGKDALNSWVSGYETLMLESEFAKKQLTTAMTAMETARASLLSKTRYIVPIEQPTLPDESLYPNMWIFTICTLLGLLLVYGLIRLIIASIREHTGF